MPYTGAGTPVSVARRRPSGRLYRRLSPKLPAIDAPRHGTDPVAVQVVLAHLALAGGHEIDRTVRPAQCQRSSVGREAATEQRVLADPSCRLQLECPPGGGEEADLAVLPRRS